MKYNDDKYNELRAQISHASSLAENGRDEKADRFQKSYLYYTCVEPRKQANEMSDYVEPVLRKAVDTVKPSLMNIFTENEKKAVQFRPLTKSAIGMELISSGAGKTIAGMVDDYINRVFIQENDGFEILDRALTEVLVSGDVFLKYFVEDLIEEETFDFDKDPEEAVDGILADWPDTDEDKMWDKMTKRKGLITGSFTAKRITPKVRIEFVPFTDVFITGQYEDIKDARYVCQRTLRTVAEMVELGYDFDDLVEGARMSAESDTLSNQRLVNYKTFGEDFANTEISPDPMERLLYVYEHYIYSSLVDKRKRKTKLYRILTTENEILEVEEANRIPFVHGCMERIPGSFWGVSMYDKLKGIQDILTRLIRATEYNAADSAYGRYIAVKGMYDKASLLNNRPGSVIEVNPEVGAAGVQRFSKEELPATISGLIERMTNSYKEDAMSFVGVDVSGSGISATAAAITANSADLKDKVIARTLAYTLFRPLFEGIYDIIVSENLRIGEMDNPQIAEAQAGVQAGQLDPSVLEQIPPVLPVSGADLPDVSDFIIDVNTANDDAMLNSQILNLMTMASQLPPGLINIQEVAAQFTGIPVEEVVKYFPVAPAPSEEDAMLEQAQKEMALEQGRLGLELIKADVAKKAAECFEIEEDVARKAAESESKVLREEEESLQKFKVLELKELELRHELETGEKIQVSEYTR